MFEVHMNKKLAENAKHSQQGNQAGCQGNFEKIATEIDIVIRIYKLLEFPDQMRLARANVILQEIFKTYIWKEKYETMKIYENSNGNLLVLNGQGANWLYFNPTELKEFFEIYGNDVRELFTSRESLRLIRMPTTPTTLADFTDDYTEQEEEIENRAYYLEFGKIYSLETLPKMKTLKHLSLGRRYIEHKHLDFVTKHLPLLESLEIKLDAQNTIGVKSAYSYCKSLLQLKKLKRLVLTACSPGKITMSYALYRDLITILDLEYLKIEMPLKHDKLLPNGAEIGKDPINLKQLNICISSDGYNSPIAIISSYFQNYENLVQLSLQLQDITLSEKSLQIIYCNCKNIAIFELTQTHVHCSEFVLPEQIKEISLNECKGLTYENLKQILSTRNLLKFNSIKTLYTGQLGDLHLPDSMQYLKCDSVPTSHIISSTKILQNMKELTWYDSYNIEAQGEHLKSCPFVERLHITSDPFPLKTLSELKHLHTLSLHHVYALNWSYVVGLLKHLTLHELKISEFYGAEVLDTPVLGFPTSVTVLRINMNMIVQADFWLDLFCQNAKLQLIFFGCIGPFHLRRLFNKPHFPKDLRTIDFSGITIKCADLRRNFNETISKTPFVKDFKSENYIKLSR